jgi:hypothetical protein
MPFLSLGLCVRSSSRQVVPGPVSQAVGGNKLDLYLSWDERRDEMNFHSK